MENFNRMTIRTNGDVCTVFKLKRERSGGYSTDMAAQRFTYTVSRAAAPKFYGSYDQCLEFIKNQGAQFMTEHGTAV